MNRKNPGQMKYKYSCVKPEDVKEGQWYSFSYNPQTQPLFERFYKVKLNTLEQWSQEHVKLFTTLRHCKVSVALEISQKGRFHYHGYIKILSNPEFYLTDLARLRDNGTYEIDFINDELKWIQYVLKQEHNMANYCKKHDMCYIIDTDEMIITESRKANGLGTTV